jgi:16S rRNA (guanine1207-N2)-methyltransferase
MTLMKKRNVTSLNLVDRIGHQTDYKQLVHEDSIIFTKEEEIRADLLINFSKPKKENSVLSLCCGMGLVAIKLSKFLDNTPQIADINLSTINDIKADMLRHGIGGRIKINLINQVDKKFDLVFLQQPSYGGIELMTELLIKAFTHLNDEGQIYLISTKREGANLHQKSMESIFGKSEKFKYGKYYLFTAKKEDFTEVPIIKEYKIDVNLLDTKLVFYSRVGLFSKSRIDAGTNLLINTMKISENDTVLDLGCGYGPIGIVAAKLARKGNVFMVDSNSRAIELAKKNISENKIENAKVIESDGFSAIRGMSFDVVISNPPTHISQDKLKLLFYDALNALRKKGRMYLVVHRSLYREYKKMLNETNIPNNVEKTAESTEYVVLLVTVLNES